MSPRDVAQVLAMAHAERRPCAPVRRLLPPGDIKAAYAVQTAWVAHRVAGGARVVGRKIGLTKSATRVRLGVPQPDFGVLFRDMVCRSGLTVDITRMLQPKIEAKIAFVLEHGLAGSAVGPEDVAAAIRYVVPALEIVDSRIAGWNIDAVDAIADNASSGLVVLGAEPVPLAGRDLAACTMVLQRNSIAVSTGSGADCFGDPLASVAWLARVTSVTGRGLRAGELVLTSALGRESSVVQGDRFHAEIRNMGEVRLSFAKQALAA